MTPRHRDVDGSRQEDGHLHCDDRSGPVETTPHHTTEEIIGSGTQQPVGTQFDSS